MDTVEGGRAPTPAPSQAPTQAKPPPPPAAFAPPPDAAPQLPETAAGVDGPKAPPAKKDRKATALALERLRLVQSELAKQQQQQRQCHQAQQPGSERAPAAGDTAYGETGGDVGVTGVCALNNPAPGDARELEALSPFDNIPSSEAHWPHHLDNGRRWRGSKRGRRGASASYRGPQYRRQPPGRQGYGDDRTPASGSLLPENIADNEGFQQWLAQSEVSFQQGPAARAEPEVGYPPHGMSASPLHHSRDQRQVLPNYAGSRRAPHRSPSGAPRGGFGEGYPSRADFSRERWGRYSAPESAYGAGRDDASRGGWDAFGKDARGVPDPAYHPDVASRSSASSYDARLRGAETYTRHPSQPTTSRCPQYASGRSAGYEGRSPDSRYRGSRHRPSAAGQHEGQLCSDDPRLHNSQDPFARPSPDLRYAKRGNSAEYVRFPPPRFGSGYEDEYQSDNDSRLPPASHDELINGHYADENGYYGGRKRPRQNVNTFHGGTMEPAATENEHTNLRCWIVVESFRSGALVDTLQAMFQTRCSAECFVLHDQGPHSTAGLIRLPPSELFRNLGADRPDWAGFVNVAALVDHSSVESGLFRLVIQGPGEPIQDCGLLTPGEGVAVVLRAVLSANMYRKRWPAESSPMRSSSGDYVTQNYRPYGYAAEREEPGRPFSSSAPVCDPQVYDEFQGAARYSLAPPDGDARDVSYTANYSDQIGPARRPFNQVREDSAPTSTFPANRSFPLSQESAVSGIITPSVSSMLSVLQRQISSHGEPPLCSSASGPPPAEPAYAVAAPGPMIPTAEHAGMSALTAAAAPSSSGIRGPQQWLRQPSGGFVEPSLAAPPPEGFQHLNDLLAKLHAPPTVRLPQSSIGAPLGQSPYQPGSNGDASVLPEPQARLASIPLHSGPPPRPQQPPQLAQPAPAPPLAAAMPTLPFPPSCAPGRSGGQAPSESIASLLDPMKLSSILAAAAAGAGAPARPAFSAKPDAPVLLAGAAPSAAAAVVGGGGGDRDPRRAPPAGSGDLKIAELDILMKRLTEAGAAAAAAAAGEGGRDAGVPRHGVGS